MGVVLASQLPVAAANDLGAINHFIVIYQENWSFDGLYGNFPGANGISNASSVATNKLDRLSGNPIGTLASYDPVLGAIPTQNPPVPLNVGVVLVLELPLAGVVRVTSGAVVSTVNVSAALVPLLPAASDWLAWAV